MIQTQTDMKKMIDFATVMNGVRTVNWYVEITEYYSNSIADQ